MFKDHISLNCLKQAPKSCRNSAIITNTMCSNTQGQIFSVHFAFLMDFVECINSFCLDHLDEATCIYGVQRIWAHSISLSMVLLSVIPRKLLEPKNPEKWNKNLRNRTGYKMFDQLVGRYIWGNNKSFGLMQLGSLERDAKVLNKKKIMWRTNHRWRFPFCAVCWIDSTNFYIFFPMLQCRRC